MCVRVRDQLWEEKIHLSATLDYLQCELLLQFPYTISVYNALHFSLIFHSDYGGYVDVSPPPVLYEIKR